MTDGPQLLMEGYCPDFVPVVSYVRQGDKVLFFDGKPSDLLEGVSGVQVVESIDQLQCEVDERDEKRVVAGTWVVEGPFQRSDVKNANGRIYSRRIWEKLVADPKSEVQKTIRERGMIGHLEHPKDGRTDLGEGALLTTALMLKPDGVVWGRAEILDTPKGRILKEYTQKRVRWGVSSRGNGSVGTDGQVNEKDYTLSTFDAVAAPSTPGAYPRPGRDVQDQTESTVRQRAEASDDGLSETLHTTAEQAVALCYEMANRPVSGLSESERSAEIARMMQQLGYITSLAKSDAVDAMTAYDVQTALLNRLNRLHQSSIRLDESARPARQEEQDARETALRRITDACEARVAELCRERDDLAESLRAATEKADEMRRLLRLERGRRKRAVSEALRAQRSISESVVADLRRQVQNVRRLLAEATAERGRQLQSRAPMYEAEVEPGRAVPAVRPVLPAGTVVSASSVVTKVKPVSSPASSGAALAAAAVAAVNKPSGQ